MASPSDPVQPPNKKRKLKTQMRPAGPGALNKKKKRRVSGEEFETEAEDKGTRSRKLNADKTASRELRKRAVVVSPAASTAAAAVGLPAQPHLSLPSVPANPSTPGQRYGERVVFCSPYRSIIQRYRLSDSPEPAPSPPLGPAPLHLPQGEPEHEPTVRE